MARAPASTVMSRNAPLHTASTGTVSVTTRNNNKSSSVGNLLVGKGVRIPLAPPESAFQRPDQKLCRLRRDSPRTAMLVATIHGQKNRAGSTYRVLRRATVANDR
jgi:hypothetical protein